MGLPLAGRPPPSVPHPLPPYRKKYSLGARSQREEVRTVVRNGLIHRTMGIPLHRASFDLWVEQGTLCQRWNPRPGVPGHWFYLDSMGRPWNWTAMVITRNPGDTFACRCVAQYCKKKKKQKKLIQRLWTRRVTDLWLLLEKRKKSRIFYTGLSWQKGLCWLHRAQA